MQLIVLGMHRSGTSCVARLLNMMGAYLGPEGMIMSSQEDNPKGFWERKDVMELNDEILHSAGGTWEQVADLDFNQFPGGARQNISRKVHQILIGLDAHRPWYLKDPRMCITFPFWRDLLEFPVVLLVYRNPIQVARSLKNRNSIPIHVGIALWEYYTVSALNRSQGITRIIIRYEDLLNSPYEVVDNLHDYLTKEGGVGLRCPEEKEVTSFVTKDLCHVRHDANEYGELLNQAQITLVEFFENNSIIGETDTVSITQSSLDILKAQSAYRHNLSELNDNLEGFQANLGKAREALNNARTELVEGVEENSRVRQQLSDSERVRNVLESDLSEAHSALAAVETDRTSLQEERERNAALQSEIERISGVNSELERQKTRLHRDKQDLSAQVALLGNQKNDFSARLSEADKQKQDLQEEVSQLWASQKTLEGNLADVTASHDETKALLQRAQKTSDKLRLAILRANAFGELDLLTKISEQFQKVPGVQKLLTKARERIYNNRVKYTFEQLSESGLFDSEYYLKTYPDVKEAGIDPLFHFVTQGVFENRRPNSHFDPGYYLKECEDVMDEGMNPLLHYYLTGWMEGRNPSGEFDADFYRELYRTEIKGGLNPLSHYLKYRRDRKLLGCKEDLRSHLVKLLDKPRNKDARIKYYIERFDSDCIEGWVFDIEQKQKSLGLYICVDKDLVINGETDIERIDVNSHHGITAASGFKYLFPDYISNGETRHVAIFIKYYDSYILIDEKEIYLKKIFELIKNKDKYPGKIVLFCSHNLKNQGAQNSLFELTVGLKKYNKISPLLVSREDGVLRELYNNEGVDVIVNNINYLNSNEKLWERELFSLCSFLENISPAALVANTLHSFYWILAAHKVGIPAIFIPRESEDPATYFDYLPAFLREAAQNTLLLADKVVFVANSTKKGWENYLGHGDNFTVINNALNLDRINESCVNFSRDYIRKSFAIEDDEIVLLSLGTVSKRKGQLDLIQALPAIADHTKRCIKVFIVGVADAPMGTQLYDYNKLIFEAIDNLPSGLKECVILYPETDNYPEVSVSDFYISSDIFLFTSRIESYPRVILEAMFFGLPIVTTPCFGVKEQCVEGVNSYFYKEGNVEELAHKVALLINDDAKRHAFASGSEHLFSHFRSYKMMLKQYQSELMSMMVK